MCEGHRGRRGRGDVVASSLRGACCLLLLFALHEGEEGDVRCAVWRSGGRGRARV